MNQADQTVVIHGAPMNLRTEFERIVRQHCYPQFDDWLHYQPGGNKNRMELWIGEVEARRIYYHDQPKSWRVYKTGTINAYEKSWPRFAEAGKRFLKTFLAESAKLNGIIDIEPQHANHEVPDVTVAYEVTARKGGKQIDLTMGFHFELFVGLSVFTENIFVDVDIRAVTTEWLEEEGSKYSDTLYEVNDDLQSLVLHERGDSNQEEPVLRLTDRTMAKTFECPESTFIFTKFGHQTLDRVSQDSLADSHNIERDGRRRAI